MYGPADKGFSLIEMLMAMAILSLTAVALLEGQAQSLRVASTLQEKNLASFVADNRLALLLSSDEALVPGSRSGVESQLGTEFRWQETVRLLKGQNLYVLTVSVSRDGDSPLVNLTGFRRAT